MGLGFKGAHWVIVRTALPSKEQLLLVELTDFLRVLGKASFLLTEAGIIGGYKIWISSPKEELLIS